MSISLESVSSTFLTSSSGVVGSSLWWVVLWITNPQESQNQSHRVVILAYDLWKIVTPLWMIRAGFPLFVCPVAVWCTWPPDACCCPLLSLCQLLSLPCFPVTGNWPLTACTTHGPRLLRFVSAVLTISRISRITPDDGATWSQITRSTLELCHTLDSLH